MTNFVRIFILSCTLGFCSSYSLAKSAMTQVSTELAMINEISPQDFNQLVQQNRFKSVILHRPEHDRGHGVTVYQLRDIAEQAKISLIYQPIDQAKNAQTDIQAFARYYNSLPKPILIMCKSGQRSMELYQQAKQQGLLND